MKKYIHVLYNILVKIQIFNLKAQTGMCLYCDLYHAVTIVALIIITRNRSVYENNTDETLLQCVVFSIHK